VHELVIIETTKDTFIFKFFKLPPQILKIINLHKKIFVTAHHLDLE